MAVIKKGYGVLSNVVQTQVDLHGGYGGVVPELASREHLNNILPVVKEAVKKAGIHIRDIGAVAVTVGPGLMGSLLVGLNFAKALALGLDIPLIPVNHLEGHVLSVLLEESRPGFPYVVLTASGGHTCLYYVKAPKDYQLLGQTLDDAAGEAFDKVAKLMGLGYPGGRVIEELARNGEKGKIQFPKAFLSKGSMDFSFSGVKTSVALFYKKWSSLGNSQEMDGITLGDIAYAFQEAVVDVLVEKLFTAQRYTGAKDVVMAGGVACNGFLRARIQERAEEESLRSFFPSPQYCTDNGAMIALAGMYSLELGCKEDLYVDARARYPL